MDLTGKRVIVTGAGQVSGRATAAMLARRGSTVVAMTRPAADLETLRAETGCEGRVVDLTDAEATRRAARAASLVDGTGVTEPQLSLEATTEACYHLHSVHTRVPMIVAQELARDLLARGEGGAIVNASIIAALRAISDRAALCASRAELDGLTRAMALELAPKDIGVDGVHATITPTLDGHECLERSGTGAPMPSRIPAGRSADPDDVAGVIPYQPSDEAAMLNGPSLPVDRGFTIT